MNTNEHEWILWGNDESNLNVEMIEGGGGAWWWVHPFLFLEDGEEEVGDLEHDEGHGGAVDGAGFAGPTAVG